MPPYRPNTLSEDTAGNNSQVVAFRGAKHWSPQTANGVIGPLHSGATNFSRMWIYIENPSANGASIWIGHENNVTNLDTARRGKEIPPGRDATYPFGLDVPIYIFCTAVQRIFCEEAG